MNLIFFLLVFSSCGNKTDVLFSIPSDAIPFEYSEEKQKAILLNGTLNDSIPLKILFDTGDFGIGIRVSDSLKGMLDGNDNFLQIGVAKNPVNVSFLNKDNWFFRYLGANAACIGWDFFSNKIIEISYQHKYIRELKNPPQSTIYKRVKIDNRMRIPIKILIQGNWITKNTLMDTGYNGLLDLSSDIIDDYSINMDSAQPVISFMPSGDLQKWFIPFDSISVCSYSISASHPLGIIQGKWKGGLLGNAFFDNFDVILDLKNYYLYLKPIEKK